MQRGTGTPIVLIHGFGVDHRVLLPLDPVFDNHGDWRRLYVDLPGTAGTPIGAVSSSEEMAEHARKRLRAELGDEPFALVGNSYGGMMARRLAHDFGDQVLGLAVLVGVFVAEHDNRTVPEPTVLRVDPGLEADASVLDDYRQEAVVQSPTNLEAFRRHLKPGIDAVDEAALERVSQAYALDADPEDTASGPFDRPTLILCGRQDHVVGYVDAWRRLEHYPRATFAVVDAAGHMAHLEQPSVTATLFTDWLDRMVQHHGRSTR